MLRQARASAGEKKEALKILVIYNGLRDDKEVFTWLERVYRERSSWLVWMKFEPRFDWIRSDPRFVSLLNRMKLA